MSVNEVINHIIEKERVISSYTYYNADCLKCGEVHKRMIRVGALVFCEVCFKKVFGSATEFKIGSELHEVYKHWLSMWKKKYG